MRLPPARMRRVFLPAIMLACALAGPASAIPFIGGGGGKVTVTLVGLPECNNCGTGSPSALKVRMFAVADSTAIRTILNNKTLSWSKQLDAAAANMLGKPVEEFVGPGATKTVVVPRDPKATAIVIQGNFCKKTGAAWYVVHPAKKKQVKLEAGATGFQLTPRK